MTYMIIFQETNGNPDEYTYRIVAPSEEEAVIRFQITYPQTEIIAVYEA